MALDIKKLGISTKKGGRRITRQENVENLEKLTVDQAIDRFVGARNLKSLLTLHFSHVLLHSLKSLHIPTSKRPFWPDFGPITGCGLDFGTP